MDTSNSEFYHFGILPKICIHSLDEDSYSKMYKPKKQCDCGCDQWIESTMKIIQSSGGLHYPEKRVHRCKNCNDIRTSIHIGVENENN